MNAIQELYFFYAVNEIDETYITRVSELTLRFYFVIFVYILKF